MLKRSRFLLGVLMYTVYHQVRMHACLSTQTHTHTRSEYKKDTPHAAHARELNCTIARELRADRRCTIIIYDHRVIACARRIRSRLDAVHCARGRHTAAEPRLRRARTAHTHLREAHQSLWCTRGASATRAHAVHVSRPDISIKNARPGAHMHTHTHTRSHSHSHTQIYTRYKNAFKLMGARLCTNNSIKKRSDRRCMRARARHRHTIAQEREGFLINILCAARVCPVFFADVPLQKRRRSLAIIIVGTHNRTHTHAPCAPQRMRARYTCTHHNMLVDPILCEFWVNRCI